MVYTREFIKVFGLVLGVTLLKSGNGTEHCNHPWKQDFGLHINDSTEESFNSLSNILEGFLTITTSGKFNDIIEKEIKTCVMSSNCKIYTLLDKKLEKSLTFCIVVNGSETCYKSNCTCQKNDRKIRAVSSRVHNTTNKDKPGPRKDFVCTIMPSSSSHVLSTHHFRTDSRTENLTKCINASMLTTDEQNIFIGDVPLRGVSIWLNAMPFFIGVGVGTLFGGFLSFIAFRRKYSCFGSNKKENVDKALNDDICFNEITEYSEIPEYTKRVDLEEKEKLLDEPDLRTDQPNMTNVEYHECIPMFNKDNKCESDFERKHIDVKEHAKGKINEYMEHPLDTFSNNPDIDTDDKKPKGQNGVTVVLYETPTEPYFLLSTTRDTKDSQPDFTGCAHHDKNQGEPANSKTLPITSEDVNHKNTDESTYQEGKEQPIENEYFVLKERS
ncbi:uncharacterized protein LOC128157870 [Crassostrea angulata]|uniref:uncharacterized protein LOC128157870 n=1 Tax=Magallana angulata TaxID=2784310 RepID=UPI0022B186DA|nr:uncharacterized protein LOC128157870 [Crassostrea angulata]